MQILFLALLFILGAAMGSFLCCQSRRLHLKDTKKKSLGKRSVCLHCKYRLKWYDNIPIISWLFLKGKCRKCHRKIGIAELLSELSIGASFLAIGTTIDILKSSPLEWGIFIVVLIFTTIIGFLAIYDGLYGELPTFALILALIFACLVIILRLITPLANGKSPWQVILMAFLGAAVLGGLYLLLYVISKGKWVGDGDWLLALAIGFALGSPWLATIALFLANFTASLIMLPMVKKKKKPPDSFWSIPSSCICRYIYLV